MIWGLSLIDERVREDRLTHKVAVGVPQMWCALVASGYRRGAGTGLGPRLPHSSIWQKMGEWVQDYGAGRRQGLYMARGLSLIAERVREEGRFGVPMEWWWDLVVCSHGRGARAGAEAGRR